MNGKIQVHKRLDQFRRNLLLLWRDAEDIVPDEFKPQTLQFRSATQNLLVKLGLVKSKKDGTLVFEGDLIDE